MSQVGGAIAICSSLLGEPQDGCWQLGTLRIGAFGGDLGCDLAAPSMSCIVRGQRLLVLHAPLVSGWRLAAVPPQIPVMKALVERLLALPVTSRSNTSINIEMLIMGGCCGALVACLRTLLEHRDELPVVLVLRRHISMVSTIPAERLHEPRVTETVSGIVVNSAQLEDCLRHRPTIHRRFTYFEHGSVGGDLELSEVSKKLTSNGLSQNIYGIRVRVIRQASASCM